MRIKLIFIFLLGFFSFQTSQANIASEISKHCPGCEQLSSESTATVILDKGETALLSRAWLTNNAARSIDIQYFIWSEDNIGILAAASLLNAADRGVKVRVIVDDFLVKTGYEKLIALDKHENIQIKIYNPLHKVGVSKWKRIWNLLFQFRDANQRMHDKLAIFDNQIAITGGRNMADEYFDFNKEYSFRDRDILVYGKSTQDMQNSFTRFWQHDLSKPLNKLLTKELATQTKTEQIKVYNGLRQYEKNTNNFSPEVRKSIEGIQERFDSLVSEMKWSKARFIADIPGKNSGKEGLGGGGISTSELTSLIRNANQEIIIQTPYLVLPENGLELFQGAIQKGVKIQISTNSLASTDNLAAFSGYHKIRDQLLDIGVEVFEYKPKPEIFNYLYQRSDTVEASNITFAIHAKSMVVDSKVAVIGTFNLDPRSINLNTEVAMIVPEKHTANELRNLIKEDMKPENSWMVSTAFNPDDKVSELKRMKLFFLKLLPLQSIL